jgi:hypothetical protein
MAAMKIFDSTNLCSGLEGRTASGFMEERNFR